MTPQRVPASLPWPYCTRHPGRPCRVLYQPNYPQDASGNIRPPIVAFGKFAQFLDFVCRRLFSFLVSLKSASNGDQPCVKIDVLH